MKFWPDNYWPDNYWPAKYWSSLSGVAFQEGIEVRAVSQGNEVKSAEPNRNVNAAPTPSEVKA